MSDGMWSLAHACYENGLLPLKIQMKMFIRKLVR